MPPEETPADLTPTQGKAALEKMQGAGARMLLDPSGVEQHRFDTWLTTTEGIIKRAFGSQSEHVNTLSRHHSLMSSTMIIRRQRRIKSHADAKIWRHR